MKAKRVLSLVLALCLCVGVLGAVSVPAHGATSQNETIIFNFLIDEMGFNEAAASGVLANIEKESGFRNDVIEYGYTWETGGGYGICQWTNTPRLSSTGRRSNLVNWCTNNGYDYTSLIGQLYYLKYELNTSYYYNSVTKILLSVPNTAEGAYQAGYTWCYSFEIPAGYNTGVSDLRGSVAQNTYWPKYDPSASTDSCGCSTGYFGTYICTTTSSGLTLRSGHGTSYSSIGSIPPNALVTVTQASGTGNGDWAHVTYNGISGYASMRYLSMKQGMQGRDIRAKVWFAATSMGSPVSAVRSSDGMYLCYKLYDAKSGALLDTFSDAGDYTAVMKFYETDGTPALTYTFNYDNEWIAVRRSALGSYKGELVFTWKNGGTVTTTASVAVVSEPCAIPSASELQLSTTGTKSQTIQIAYFGSAGTSNITLDCTTVGNCFSYQWGSWSNNKMPLTVTAVRAGQGTITVRLREKSTGKVLFTSQVDVTVTAPTYTVSYHANGGGGAPGNQTKHYNTTLTLSSAKPYRTGYTFLGWATNASASSPNYQPGDSFTKDANTTLYALWKRGCESHSYSCTVTKTPTLSASGSFTGACSNCLATTQGTLPKLNTTDYTRTIKNNPTCTQTGTAQYVWKNTTYGNICVDGAVPATGHVNKTVAANTEQGYSVFTCKACGYSYRENFIFPDVPHTLWSYEAIKFAVDKGYFSGYKNGNFGPSDSITRQDFVVVLARIAGVDLSEYAGRTNFPDVKAGDYYEKAVKWASTNGIVNGYKNGNFGVGDQITREQMVTILYNYARKMGYDTSVSADAAGKLNAFGDAHKITGYARPAVIWALDKGVIEGMNATKLSPENNATRGQVAKVLMNISSRNIMPI